MGDHKEVREPSVLTWHVGDVVISRVEERIVPVPWHALVPDGEAVVDNCRPWLEPHISTSGSHLLLSMHSFVVQTPDHLIVVDTCVGRDDLTLPGDPAFGDRLAAVLPGGFDAVDVVVCTHLHFDHVGWNTIEHEGQLLPRFPNARYLATTTELDAERDAEDTNAFERSVAPLAAASCLDAVASDHRIDPWVTLEPSPGHTPGHVSVRIGHDSSQPEAVITGDLVHTPLQFAYPAASSRPDFDPAMATQTRERFVASEANTETLVLGTHFPPPTSGVLRNRNGVVSFETS